MRDISEVNWKQSFATRGDLNLFSEAAVFLTIYVVDVDRRRSISGVVFTLRENTVSWRSSLYQPRKLNVWSWMIE